MSRAAALLLAVLLTGALAVDAGARKPAWLRVHAHAVFAVAKGKHRLRMPKRWARARAPHRLPRPAVAPVMSPMPPPVALPAPVPTAAPTVTPTVPTANPRSLSVRSTEWSFTLSQASVLAGTVRIQFDNSRAEDPHQLSVLSEDLQDAWTTGPQDAGSVTARTYVLHKGVYTLFCPLPEHEERGMKATLTVR